MPNLKLEDLLGPSPVPSPLWRAIAGPEALLPSRGSLVCYFPDGHTDYAYTKPNLFRSAAPCERDYYRCRVVDLALLADDQTAEVFAKITLHPMKQPIPNPDPDSEAAADVGDAEEAVESSSAKILTPIDIDDAFVVPPIFPPLGPLCGDSQPPPPQVITARDVRGAKWDFELVYENLGGGTMQRCLKFGWGKFRQFRNLAAGDVVVFVKDSKGALTIGIRRESNRRGRVLGGRVLEAVEQAEEGRTFEVAYYPVSGTPFVVAKDAVDAAMRVDWKESMRVEMSVPVMAGVDTLVSTDLFHGTVFAVDLKPTGPWPRSPWRMLKVYWDEIKSCTYVCPWQVTAQAKGLLNAPSSSALGTLHTSAVSDSKLSISSSADDDDEGSSHALPKDHTSNYESSSLQARPGSTSTSTSTSTNRRRKLVSQAKKGNPSFLSLDLHENASDLSAGDQNKRARKKS